MPSLSVPSTKELLEALNVFGKTPPASPAPVPALIPLPALPASTRSYNSLVLWRDRWVFILRGDGYADFWAYDIERGALRTLASTPAAISYGSLVGVHADRYLYTIRGALTTTFYRYDIYMNRWETVASVPASIDFTGGGACYDGSRYIYVVRGGGYTDFYRYDCVTNTWTTLAPLPVDVLTPSNCVVAKGNVYVLAGAVYDPAVGDYVPSTTFLRYSIAENKWYFASSAPYATSGGALAYDGVDTIYALAGNATVYIMKYSVSANAWSTMPRLTAATLYGGLLYYVSRAIGALLVVRRGYGTAEWLIYKL